MSGNQSCKGCGCSEIDTDPSRGDAVCTNCGCVLEDSIIVSEVTFEEDGHGGASAIGQFVSAESRGGGILSAVGGGGFHTSVGKESREITLRNSKKKIIEVAQQLRLNQHCIDVAFNFFRMALHKQLTKGRKNCLTIAAVIYMTCRIEGTPHLLIDFSDVLQMDVYALGRAYCQISRSLYINIPAVDPCMYILRFAHKFDLGDKTHEVAMTALRMVQRMKRDWIHLGRRPSGLCGAALLISARLHNFSRSVQDVIRVVKVHETTLRKRLVEFGETPSSSLTLDEFMSVDLEEEADPPSYKAARIRDRERLAKLLDSEASSKEFKELQAKIEEGLDKRRIRMASKAAVAAGASPGGGAIGVGGVLALVEEAAAESAECCGPAREKEDESHFILEATLDTINSIISTSSPPPPPPTPTTDKGQEKDVDRILMPPPPVSSSSSSLVHCHPNLPHGCGSNKNSESTGSEVSMALVPLGQGQSGQVVPSHQGGEGLDGELDLDGIDDTEINGYIMTSVEVERKTLLWEDLNKEYIEAQRLKQEQLERDILEGKVDKKKKKKAAKVKPTFQAKSANEAIKIMLKERKISSKINYDVLRSLTAGVDFTDEGGAPAQPSTSGSFTTVIESGHIIPPGNKRKFELPPTDSSDASSTSSSGGSRKKSKSSRRRSRSTSIEEVGVGVGGVNPKKEKKAEEEEDKKPERKPKLEKIKMGTWEEEEEESDKKATKSRVVEEGEEAEDKIKLKKEKQQLQQLKILEQLKEVVYGVKGGGAEGESGQGEGEEEEEEDEDLDEEEEEEDEASLSTRDLLIRFRGDGEADHEDEDYYE